MHRVDKEPKKPAEWQDEDQNQLVVTNIPLTIVVSALINMKDWFDWIVRAAEVLVVFVLTYNIIGKTLFVALVITPLLVFFIESAIECYWAVCCDDGSNGDDDDDPHFGDHFNNNLK